MARPSNRDERRAQIIEAFARVLARNGYAGATIQAIAREAGLTPGLLHHHFEDKEEMLSELLRELMRRFRVRLERYDSEEPALDAYVDAALELDADADVIAARCWVGLLAEAVRRPALATSVRRVMDAQIDAIAARSGHRLTPEQASATMAYVVGSLVVGAFVPDKARGFAAPGLHALLESF